MMTAALLRRLRTLSQTTLPLHADGPLTSRERDVVVLVVEGMSNKEIGGRLNIEVSTVKNHIHSIYRKLNIRRRAQLSEVADSFARRPFLIDALGTGEHKAQDARRTTPRVGYGS